MTIDPMSGWEGIPWEAAERCVYCGLNFGCTDNLARHAFKREHRLTCPSEKPPASDAVSAAERRRM